MSETKVMLASLSAAMDGGFTAIADVSRALASAGAEGDYRLIVGLNSLASANFGTRNVEPAWVRAVPQLQPKEARRPRAIGTDQRDVFGRRASTRPVS